MLSRLRGPSLLAPRVSAGNANLFTAVLVQVFAAMPAAHPRLFGLPFLKLLVLPSVGIAVITAIIPAQNRVAGRFFAAPFLAVAYRALAKNF